MVAPQLYAVGSEGVVKWPLTTPRAAARWWGIELSLCRPQTEEVLAGAGMCIAWVKVMGVDTFGMEKQHPY